MGLSIGKIKQRKCNSKVKLLAVEQIASTRILQMKFIVLVTIQAILNVHLFNCALT